jgi:hypothetical protein
MFLEVFYILVQNFILFIFQFLSFRGGVKGCGSVAHDSATNKVFLDVIEFHLVRRVSL